MLLGEFLDLRLQLLELLLVQARLIRLRFYSLLQVVEARREDRDETKIAFEVEDVPCQLKVSKSLKYVKQTN